jgi:hypothetical protein
MVGVRIGAMVVRVKAMVGVRVRVSVWVWVFNFFVGLAAVALAMKKNAYGWRFDPNIAITTIILPRLLSSQSLPSHSKS